MKKGKYIIKSLLVGMVMLAMACQKDNQSFVYDEVNDIKVTDAIVSYTVGQNDVLSIQPTFVESKPGNDTFSYSWKLGDVELSTQKNFSVKITQSPGAYSLIFRVKSNQTGISTIFRYNITVQGVFYGGFMVVHNQAGVGKLSLIRTDDVIFDNPLATQNNKTYPGKAMAAYLSSFTSFYGAPPLLLYFTDQNIYKFNPNDLFELGAKAETIPSFNSFPIATTPFYMGADNDQHIIIDGGLYLGLGPSFFPAEVVKPFSERVPGDFVLFPGMFNLPTGGVYYYYDQKYQRFMTTPAFGRSLNVVPASLAGSAFNVANVGRKLIAADRGGTNEFYYLMQDNAGLRYLMTTISGAASAASVNKLMNASPEIANATCFASSTALKQVYYTVANKIYLHDVNANTAQLIYTFPVGYVIKDIKLVRTTIQRLVVATNNGAAGEVYYFDMDGLGKFANNTYLKKFTGFGDIVQVNPR